jgi:hypothetical protein
MKIATAQNVNVGDTVAMIFYTDGKTYLGKVIAKFLSDVEVEINLRYSPCRIIRRYHNIFIPTYAEIVQLTLEI